jgi:hypothetical protein
MGRGTRFVAVMAATGVALLVGAGSASATFHLMKLREVSAGTGSADSSYVEIQAYAPLQKFLSGGATVVRCNSTCSTPSVFTPFTDVVNGNNQDTVVFGDSGLAAGSKDFTVDGLNLDAIAAGGAVCYVSEPGFNDCVSWGNFSGNSTLMTNYGTSAGTPAAALSSGMALRRSIAAGCPTALEPGDDTDNSAADFAVTTPNPRPNSVAPTETACAPVVPGNPTQPNPPSSAKKKKKCKKKKRSPGTGSAGPGTGTGNSPAYAAKKTKCKEKKRK